jgi:hypothetical protein
MASDCCKWGTVIAEKGRLFRMRGKTNNEVSRLDSAMPVALRRAVCYSSFLKPFPVSLVPTGLSGP